MIVCTSTLLPFCMCSQAESARYCHKACGSRSGSSACADFAAALQDEVLLLRGAAWPHNSDSPTVAGLQQQRGPSTGYRPTSLEWDIW